MKNKTKVLMFVDRMRHGGIQQFLIENIKYIDQTNLQIDVLTLDDNQEYPLEKTLQELGCNFYKLKNIWINKITDYLRYAHALDKFFKEHNDYKVVHMNASSKNFLLLKYAKKYQVPVRIVHSHNIDFQTKNPLKKLLGNIFKIPMKKYATDYFACSVLAGEWLFGKNSYFKVIHNAIDYNRFKFNLENRQKIRAQYNIQDEDILVGHVGRFTNQKNHDFLIDIFNEMSKQNPNVKLILVGIGEKEEEIKAKVTNLNLTSKVIFAGFKNNVHEIMHAMDIFLFPSKYEGLGLVLIEAQASGLPSFTSEIVVPEEAKLSSLLTYINLAKPASYWASEILNSNLQRKDIQKEIEESGYLIEITAKELEDFYLN